ncbi:DUF255 domain-containing protein [Candidatus Pacearchaeota archaeon]|nr:DUF255 domain-containing protein [Candidatus Pacearchaeota archaeon]
MIRKIILIISVLLLIPFILPTVLASNHYTFEHSEELKSLIEWRDYGPDAFNEAIAQNKPIFLLLTAPSWCYWCQVYESEDYLFAPEVVKELNEKFIPIYVDADKRQDLTRKYLEGGWPSTTIMTPNGERLFGYSGPRPIQNMLANLNNAVQYVNSNGFSNQVSYDYKKAQQIIPTTSQLNNIVSYYQDYTNQVYDPIYGGFGTGQKFPQGRTLDFALETYEQRGNQEFLKLVQNTLQNQYTKVDEIKTNYNLFDPVEGGFHRYGTQRDWTPPHYEKMLYDNVKLLKAYSHLLQISPDDSIAKEVVDKTQNYIEVQWYDSQNGGFYGNTDVHGEDEYYGENPRPADKPRVEKTKYTDWNSDAILTYLYLWEITGDKKYKEMAEKSLNFFSKEMVTDEGVYHFMKEDGTKGVRGSILDNSYMLLAFVEGYEVLGNEKYLQTAQKIADYSLDNLYDWNSGGFFERNSKDLELYAPGENIDLSKPQEENGIISYALLKLYKQTNNPNYLNAGIKTLGNKISETGGLDNGYYYVKSAQYIIGSNLLTDFEKQQEEIRSIEELKQADFWVNELVKSNSESSNGQFVLSEKGLDKLEGPILLLLIIALISGFISFASPCTLPILPAYVAYTFESSKKNIKGMTISFFLGLSLIFVLLGMTATFIGNFLKSNLTVFSQIAGIAIIFFGVYILLGKGFSGLKIQQKRPVSYLGSFAFGAILGISWTPCVGPILVAILLLASTTSSVFTGGLLLFAYAVGLALPLVLFSTYLSKINKEGRLWKIIKGKLLRIKIGEKEFSVHTNSLISGILFIILGYLIFSGILYSFNQYVVSSSFQQWIFDIEDKLLGWIK